MSFVSELKDNIKTSEKSNQELGRDIVEKILKADNLGKKSSYLGYLDFLLSEDLVNPDEIIPLIINGAVDIGDLVGIILCFKNRGNPNLYLNTSGVGPSHLLIYGFKKLGDRVPLYKFFYTICVLLGSNVFEPAFYTEKPEELLKEVLKNSHRRIEDVNRWLLKYQIDYPKNSIELLEVLKLKNDVLSHQIAIFIDLPELYSNLTLAMFPSFLVSRNPKWNFLFNGKEDFKPTNPYLIEGAKAFFAMGVISILELFPGSYYDFTFWIISYRNAMMSGNHFFIEQIEMIIKAAIARGHQCDLYQFDEIGSINPDFKRELVNIYRSPLWSKVVKIPETLLKDAMQFGIPSNASPSEIKDFFLNLTSADIEAIKKAIKRKNKGMIIYSLDSILNFISNPEEDIIFANRNSYEYDPLLYSEYSIAYYRDNDNRVWIYLSNMFENILKNPFNTISGKRFPEEFLLQVEYKIKNNKLFDFEKPINLENLIDKIKENDEITNLETDFEIRSVLQIAGLNGITKESMLSKISLSEYNRRFSKIGIDFYQYYPISNEPNATLIEIKSLSSNLSLAIICKILYVALNKKLETAISFFHF